MTKAQKSVFCAAGWMQLGTGGFAGAQLNQSEEGSTSPGSFRSDASCCRGLEGPGGIPRDFRSPHIFRGHSGLHKTSRRF